MVEEPVVETVVKEEEPKSAVLGESLKLSAGLRHSISLNDSFRFSRELFGGDTDLMNRVIEQISVMSSYKTAVAFLSSKVELNEEKEAVNDFLELLKKYFKSISIKQKQMGKLYVVPTPVGNLEDMTFGLSKS